MEELQGKVKASLKAIITFTSIKHAAFVIEQVHKQLIIPLMLINAKPYATNESSFFNYVWSCYYFEVLYYFGLWLVLAYDLKFKDLMINDLKVVQFLVQY